MRESETLVATITQSSGISPEGVLAIGGLVMILSQITMRSIPGDVDEWAPLIAIAWSSAAAWLWIYSQPEWPPRQTDYFQIAVALAGIIITAMGAKSAAGMTTKTLSVKARRARSKARQPEPIPPSVPPIPEPAGDDAHVIVPTEMPGYAARSGRG